MLNNVISAGKALKICFPMKWCCLQHTESFKSTARLEQYAFANNNHEPNGDSIEMLNNVISAKKALKICLPMKQCHLQHAESFKSTARLEKYAFAKK